MKRSLDEIVKKLDTQRIERIESERVQESKRLELLNKQREYLRIRYPQSISVGGKKQNMVDPCLGAEIWPTDPYTFLGGYVIGVDLEFIRTTIEGSISIGDKYFIVDQTQLPLGTDIFARHTGEMAEWVGLGNGSEGSGWSFTSLPSGTLVGFPNSVDYIVVEEVGTTNYTDNGGSGKMGVGYYGVVVDLPVPSQISLQTSNNTTQTNRADYIDPCRRVKIIWSDDFTTYYEIDQTWSDIQLLDGINLPPDFFPPEAITCGFIFTRGQNIQIQYTL